MIRRLLCWLGDWLGKDWHKWETLYTHQSEYEPELTFEMQKCNFCRQRRSVTKHCGKVKR